MKYYVMLPYVILSIRGTSEPKTILLVLNDSLADVGQSGLLCVSRLCQLSGFLKGTFVKQNLFASSTERAVVGSAEKSRTLTSSLIGACLFLTDHQSTHPSLFRLGTETGPVSGDSLSLECQAANDVP
jgi:hypothetical protein